MSLASVLWGAAGLAQPLQSAWATPTRELKLLHVSCGVDAGAARVSAFDGFAADDCATTPLGCNSPEARVAVLRGLDAGTLEFPRAHRSLEADGWFEVPLEAQGVLLVECPAQLFTWSPGGEAGSEFIAPSTGEFASSEVLESRVVVINPWTRRTALVEGASLSAQASSLTAGCWATTLGAQPRTRSPVHRDFDFDTPTMGAMFGARPGFRAPRAPSPSTFSLRVEAKNLTPRPLSISLTSPDGGVVERVETRADGRDFSVSAGRYTLRVSMPGALQFQQVIEVPGALRVTLEPAMASVVHVVDSTGNRVSRAVVFIDGVEAGVTDATGEFAREVDVEKPVKVSAMEPSHGASPVTKVSTREPVTLTLAPRNHLRLRVEQPDGGAVWGMARVFRGDATSEFDLAPLRDSALDVAALSPGPHLVQVPIEGWQTLTWKFIVPASGATTMTRRLAPRPTVTGVVYRDGKPAADVQVSLARPFAARDRTVTDAAGRFSIERAEPGVAELSIDGRLVKPVTWPSEVTVELKVERPPVVRRVKR